MTIPLNSAALSHLPDSVHGPAYDRSALTPGILHVGVGNFHRAHMAVYLDQLFAQGQDHDWALVGAGVRPGDAVMRDKLAAQDWLTTVVELDPSGLTARVIGSMVDFVPVDNTATSTQNPMVSTLTTRILPMTRPIRPIRARCSG
jgi:mannitol 2-dehydrogenase